MDDLKKLVLFVGLEEESREGVLLRGILWIEVGTVDSWTSAEQLGILLVTYCVDLCKIRTITIGAQLKS